MTGSMRARRSILLAGAVAGLLLVIGLSALAVWWNARNSQKHVAALQKAHMGIGQALTGIRENVYLNAILKRDCLLDSDPENLAEYVKQFAAIRTRTEEGFRILEAAGQDEEQKSALAAFVWN